ncbi:hypothetical protein MHBO_004622 [Bonamia ostreae]|uniref:Ribosomal protein S7 n=1 Tax=Bonamia ostreae TaxID=126728 RepID=A0ABV2AUE4_9EUKA
MSYKKEDKMEYLQEIMNKLNKNFLENAPFSLELLEEILEMGKDIPVSYIKDVLVKYDHYELLSFSNNHQKNFRSLLSFLCAVSKKKKYLIVLLPIFNRTIIYLRRQKVNKKTYRRYFREFLLNVKNNAQKENIEIARKNLFNFQIIKKDRDRDSRRFVRGKEKGYLG